ncbi:hypothetical protein RBI22_01675 [Alcaligenaceae bacterium C4P045]|nr:hypothetical protein [Alcaligenaceae bacterium C4P045]
MNARRMSVRLPSLALCTAGLLLASASSAFAADSARTEIQRQYQADVARCNAGQTAQPKNVCLQEAGAARQEAMRSRLVNANQQYDQNATARCNALPAADRSACVAQMSGQGRTMGSVEGGGVLREMTIQVPANQVNAPGAAPAPMPRAGRPATAPMPQGAAPAPMAPAPMAPAPQAPGIRY